ncbi:HAD family hydrolase [Roseobacter sinensis]|uniref:HAD family hydrolase n=1 Tax=Roseobacter sinensis TaxID=2931391 RepID=A0ABT3BK94_9RHOB|nr:HAD family hydrolase [Roseobacter sp. WL0113]MCV3273976.1 HAD family hydrolase [Roseobacter sp. WL0113]
MTPPLTNRRFVLATDLDGTFLGGTAADRAALYDWIEAHRASVGLVFVSGRDPEFICELCGSGEVPWPEYVIGDVGTTIAQVTPEKAIAPIEALEREIAARWNGSGDRVKAHLETAPGLRLQPTEFRYRVSYDYDPDTFDPATTRSVEDMGFDVLISDNRYLDVLPKGVSKGPSLLRLLDHLEVAQRSVLSAGDTLNDLSMLVAGTPAVAVGGSEAPLLEALPPAPHIYRAEGVGAAGILEAVAHFNLHPTPEKV